MNRKKATRKEILERTTNDVGRLVSNIMNGYRVHEKCAIEIVQTALVNVAWEVAKFEGAAAAARFDEVAAGMSNDVGRLGKEGNE